MEKWSLETEMSTRYHCDSVQMITTLRVVSPNLEFSQKLQDLMPTILAIINEKETDFVKIK